MCRLAALLPPLVQLLGEMEVYLAALAFKDAYRMLHQRISIFVSLPLRTLGQLSLQEKLKEIGRMEGATAKAAEPT